jgi:hypothetical protein
VKSVSFLSEISPFGWAIDLCAWLAGDALPSRSLRWLGRRRIAVGNYLGLPGYRRRAVGPSTTLYFAAGSNDGANGLFGSITAN